MKKIKKLMIVLLMLLAVSVISCDKNTIKIEGASSIEVGATTKLTFLNHDRFENVKWSTNNQNIIEIEQYNNEVIVYGIAVGEAEVILEVDSKEYSYMISVVEGSTSLIIKGPNTVNINGEITLEVKTSEENVTWEADSTIVEIVPSGNTLIVKGKEVGEVLITARVGNNESYHKITVASISEQLIIEGPRYLQIASTIQLTTNIQEGITWSSNDITVATVENGLVTGIKEGVVTITASVNNQKATYIINVCPVDIMISGPSSGIVGEELHFSVSELYQDAVWSSDSLTTIIPNKNTAVFTASQPGTYTIKVSIFEQEYMFSVTIVDGSISLSGENKLVVGKTTTLSINSSPYGEKIAWESSNEQIATVDNGIVTGVSAGVVNIKAYFVDNTNISSTFTIEVIKEEEFTISCKEELTVGELTYIEVLSDGTIPKITWSISNSQNALLEDGVLLPLKEGELTITASTDQGSSQITVNVKKYQAEEISTPLLTRVEAIMENMTIEEKIGQMFIVGFSGTTITNEFIKAVSEYKFGNAIFMAYNVPNATTTSSLANDVQSLMMSELGIPAFISIDQEGGKITRMTNGATHFLGNMALAATQDSNNAYLVGNAVGAELHSYGITMDFAPVMDVNNNPLNPIIGVRSYGDNPLTVAKFGTKMIEGLQGNNVIAGIKHFPGHGNTQTDTHLSMPSIESSLNQLYKVELAPFIAGIYSGVEAIMTTHIVFNALDRDYPATLSSKVLNGLLRDTLGYQGLIVTDGMNMNAIRDNYGYQEAGVLAANASVDILTFTDIQSAILSYNGILKGYNDGTVKKDVIDAAVRRILIAKLNVGLFDSSSTTTNKVDFASHQALNKTLSEKALTLTGTFTPLTKDDEVLLISSTQTRFSLQGTSQNYNSFAKYGADFFTSRGYQATGIEVTGSSGVNTAVSTAKNYNQIVVAFDNVKSTSKQYVMTMVNRIITENPNANVIVVALETPYDILGYNNVKTYLCTYEYTPTMCEALCRYLNGEFIATGVLPIDVK